MKIRAFLAIAIRIFVSFLSFLLTYVVSTKLAIEESSLFFVFLSLQSLVLVFLTLGLNDYIIKNGASLSITSLSFSSFFVSCHLVVLSISLIFYFLFFIFLSNIYKDDIVLGVYYMAGAFVPISLISIISSFFQAKNFSYESILVLGGVAISFSAFIFLSSSVDFYHAAKFYFLSSLLSFVFSFLLFIFKVKPRLSYVINMSFLKDYELANMFLVQLLFQAFSQSSILLMGLLDERAEVSFLAVSLRVITCISIVLLAINKVISYDLAIDFKKNNIDKIKSILKKSSRLMSIFCLPLVVIILLFSKDIMQIFGAEYAEYHNVLNVLVAGQVVNILTGNVGLVLSMSGNVIYLRKSMLIGLVLSIALNITLVPSFGVQGAAWSVAISTAVINVISVYYVKKYIGINMFKVLF